MKIYFEDGQLKTPSEIPTKVGYWVVDAGAGFSVCYGRLAAIKEYERANNAEDIVYTNFSAALNNCFAWNEELRLPEVYLRNNGKWVRIDQLTNRELRAAHNLEKMWISGAFEPYEKDETK